MKKFFFYTAILVLCILVWLNKKNKEGLDSENIFIGMSPENLYNIYKVIDDMPGSRTNDGEVLDDENEDDENEDDENEDDENAPYASVPSNSKSNSNSILCSSKSIIIEKLRQLEINDDAFNKIINPEDNNLDKAYDVLIKQLKTIPSVIYKTCDTRKKKKKNKKKEHCPKPPSCNCIKDVSMCKNYTYLNYVFNTEEPSIALKIVNSGTYNTPELSKVTDIDLFKTSTLKDYLLPLPSSEEGMEDSQENEQKTDKKKEEPKPFSIKKNDTTPFSNKKNDTKPFSTKKKKK